MNTAIKRDRSKEWRAYFKGQSEFTHVLDAHSGAIRWVRNPYYKPSAYDELSDDNCDA